uniref:global nitrogen transcriptional regulator n=1 Tax=Rhodaphanes brevistipitata TaxID=446136 RepID=UPI001FCCF19B|nr:global nitrogen transcriptional regulator [Rhodaphanes brevistipitata]UNJ18543.1 global nitrogen transcriptional regulator [Rhodaphanes brevistipitata]
MLKYLLPLSHLHGELISLKSKDVLLIENYKSSYIYIILQGQVQIGKLFFSQKLITLGFFYVNDCIILPACLTEKYQIKALNHSYILVTELESVFFLIKKYKIWNFFVMRGFWNYSLKIEEFSSIFFSKTTLNRSIALLLFLAKHFGSDSSSGIEIYLNLSQASIAQIIGSTRVTITRIFKLLEQVQCIETYSDKIIIKNPTYLTILNKYD